MEKESANMAKRSEA